MAATHPSLAVASWSDCVEAGQLRLAAVNLTPKNIEDLMASAAHIIFTSSILIAVLAVAYRVAIKPLLGDVAKLRTGLEQRLVEVEAKV